MIGSLFLVAILAFESFNFDTTRYALNDLLGNVELAGLGWATVLAIAFCAIDFAGLLRIFLPDTRDGPPAEVWYLMGAWLLGATLNAIMTWWAVSLTLIGRESLGNEILDREQLLLVVPIFVSCLVWLTRILFIGSLSVASGYWFQTAERKPPKPKRPTSRPRRAPVRPQPVPALVTNDLPEFLTSRVTPQMQNVEA